VFVRTCVFASALAVLVACGSDSSESTDTSSTDTGSAATEQGSSSVLELTAPLVGGGELDLGQYAGSPVALWFWAPG
jgi:ABC-type phosphate transport system substrate-binding protein